MIDTREKLVLAVEGMPAGGRVFLKMQTWEKLWPNPKGPLGHDDYLEPRERADRWLKELECIAWEQYDPPGLWVERKALMEGVMLQGGPYAGQRMAVRERRDVIQVEIKEGPPLSVHQRLSRRDVGKAPPAAFTVRTGWYRRSMGNPKIFVWQP